MEAVVRVVMEAVTWWRRWWRWRRWWIWRGVMVVVMAVVMGEEAMVVAMAGA